MAEEKILVVDDELNIRKAMATVLEREGYAIVEARDGREALHSVLVDKPDLILLDIMLPTMNGYDVTIKLRDDDRRKTYLSSWLRQRVRFQIVSTARSRRRRLYHKTLRSSRTYGPSKCHVPETSRRAPDAGAAAGRITVYFSTAPPDQTFETFIVGPANREAHEAALAVAENPGVIHNPLFLHGEAGIGKSHLIACIANKIRRHYGPEKVVYASSELFEERIREAILTHKLDSMLNSFSKLVLLAVDDVQFLARTRSQQDRTLEIFMDLYERARQVVVCSDRPPEELNELTELVQALFSRGKVVELLVPTPYHRGRILRAVAQRNGWNIPEPVSHLPCPEPDSQRENAYRCRQTPRGGSNSHGESH